MEDFVDEAMVTESEGVVADSEAAPLGGETEAIVKMETDDKPMAAPSESNAADVSITEEDSKALVPKLKDNAKDDFLMMPPPLAPSVVQSCRPHILELDARVTVYSLDTLEPLLGGAPIGTLDLNALFPDLPMYGPPNPDDNDAYVDAAEYGRVTMISKLMASKPPSLDFGPVASQIVYIKRKREPLAEMDDFDEEDARVPRLEGKHITALPGTEPTRIVPVLFQPKKAKDMPMTPIRRPAPPGPLASKTPIVWSGDEEDLLMTIIKPFQYNWDLISDLFNNMRGPIISSERRTPWDCYEKWSKKEGSTSGSNGTSAENGSGLIPIGSLPNSAGSTPPSPKARKDKDGKKILTPIKVDLAKKTQRSLGLLEAMKKASKKREATQNRVNAGTFRTASL